VEYIRTKNALLGLAAGDALSWQALYHKSYALPFWTRRLRREIDVESEKEGIVRLNLPFSLNVPVDPFFISPTDDTEWAAFTAGTIISNNGEYNFNSHLEAWKKLAKNYQDIRGSISIKGALNNLNKGIFPPASGNDNPHYFDDSAMTRAVVIGSLFPGEKEKAAEYAGEEASVTNSLEGVWAAKAMAAAVSSACSGANIDKIISAALEQVRSSGWIREKLAKAIGIVEKHKNIFSCLPVLYDEIIDHSYNYGVSAPENLALSLALFIVSKRDITAGITAASSLAKTADSVAAFTGALCGACSDDPFEEEWVGRFNSLKGICIPELEGKNFNNIADKINSFAANNI
jgi:ADP-ribosylglycohydrolase